MTGADPLVGRVALPEGGALAGFTVELRLGTTTHSAVTDGDGEFRLDARQCDGESALLVVRAPGNEVVLRDWHRLDGRYLGLTVAREALPAGPHQGVRPTPPVERAAPVDSGDDGELTLPGARPLERGARVSVGGVRDRIGVASGTTLRVWTAEETLGDPLEIGARSEILDLAGDPASGELVVLLAGRAGRDLAVVTEEGRLERRASLEGGWDRLAVAPGGAVALVAEGSAAWAAVADGGLRVHDLDAAAVDVAFAGELVVVATGEELLSLDPAGAVLGRTDRPGQRLALATGGASAVLFYDVAAGRATRVLADPAGMLTARETILVGRSLPFGWWWDREWLVTLLGERLRWWRFPKLELQPVPPQTDITWYGPT